MPRATKITADARRAKVAANLLSDNPLPATALAPVLGVTPAHASNLLSDPTTKAMARSMLEPYRNRVMHLVPKALDRIEQALDAGVEEERTEYEEQIVDGKKVMVDKKVTVFHPDHAMRLRAADRLRRMVEVLDRGTLAAAGLPPAGEPGQIRGTLEDLLIAYRRVTTVTQE